MNDCKKCKWKDRDPKKLVEILQKLEKDNHELRNTINELIREIKSIRIERTVVFSDDDISF